MLQRYKERDQMFHNPLNLYFPQAAPSTHPTMPCWKGNRRCARSAGKVHAIGTIMSTISSKWSAISKACTIGSGRSVQTALTAPYPARIFFPFPRSEQKEILRISRISYIYYLLWDNKLVSYWLLHHLPVITRHCNVLCPCRRFKPDDQF